MKSSILDFTEKKGLVNCANFKGAINNSEILYINEAQKLGVNEVLFRRFYKNGEDTPYRSEPAVCIFNKVNTFFNSPEHIKLHAALWSAGRNEVYVINCHSRIDIINARKPANVEENGSLSIQNLILASSAAVNGINEQQFSAYLFCNGTFWEQPEFEKDLDEKSSPYIFLLDYLMTVRKKFLETPALVLLPETIDKLLVTSILIKFLEEITDDEGKHTLRNLYKKHKIQSFAEAVEQGFCVAILNDLANEFNGKIFDKFSDSEKAQISESDLSLIAKFLRANIDLNTQQLFIWEQYSFKHLPAEVISAIYENFIQAEALRQNGVKEKGVVYTPIHLVNLLIDEVMPLNQPELFANNSFRVLDPSCGSGVFLVAAFKRLLQWWAINNSTINDIQYPGSKVAQKILEDNIFGVDVKRTATLVSVFSLTTALLDKLTPQEIWNKLKFKDLSQKNIQHISFFDWALGAKQEGLSFNLIIGNPPFNIESGKKREEVFHSSILESLNFNHKKLPDNNFALHFFEGAMLFADKVCMIIPANVLLYNRAAQGYRKLIFTNYCVNKIFDFTHLRRDLFHKSVDTPVIAIIADSKPSDLQTIEHIVVKRTVSTERKLKFEIDYYDHHNVPIDWAIDETKYFVWKSNLLGGARLFHVIYRLSLLMNLNTFVANQKVANNEWIYEVGYEAGAAKNPEVIDYLHGQDKINDIDDKGNIISDSIEENKYFYRAKNKLLFQLPLLVIHKKIGDKFLPIGIKKEHDNPYLVFNSSFVGIHAPKAEYHTLEKIFSRFKENAETYILWILTQSSSAMVSQETAIKKADLDTLPFPDFDNDYYLKLSPQEIKIRTDVLSHYIHLGKSISAKYDGRILHDKVTRDKLKEFGGTFCETLNEIYSKNGAYWQQGAIFQSELYTVIQFGFGKATDPVYQFGNLDDVSLKVLVEDKLSNSGSIYTRIIRIYKHIESYDCIFFIKPNAQRYWLNSIALRDADDTFFDLKMAGF